MQSGNQDNGSSLSRTLQESLSEVLREVEGSRMSTGGGFNTSNLASLSALNRSTGFGGAGAFGSSANSFLSPGASASAAHAASLGGLMGNPNRNYAGMSTEELLKAAAMEQAEKTYQSRRLYNESTASLLALMKGNSANNGFAAGGLGGGNSLLQQSYQQMFKQQPPLMAAAPPSASLQPALPPTETKNALKVLGTSLRKKDSPYLDVSVLQDTDISDKRTRGGVTEPFPEKLHRMLKEVEDEGKSDIIGFFAHGRAFAVHDPDRFIAEIMPKYYKQSRLSSFQRQLNLYGFTRITSGPDAGGYYHELFLRGRPNLAVHMRRVGLPQGEDRRKMRAKNMKTEPNFYAMGNVDTAIVKLPGML